MTKWCRLTVEVPFDGVFNLAKLVEMNCRVCNFELLPSPDDELHVISEKKREHIEAHREHVQAHIDAVATPNGEIRPEPRPRRNWGRGLGKNEIGLRNFADDGKVFNGKDAMKYFSSEGLHPHSATATISRFLQKGWLKVTNPGHKPRSLTKAD